MTAAAEFEGPAREAVHALKYYGRHAIASTMARIMAQAVTGFPIDRVVPVSLHRSRLRERGYDQAELLARGVAGALDLRCEPDTLTRVRRTRQQTTLSADQRKRNVTGAFETREDVSGETVLLIDDVYTTGATMEAAASALRAAGADRVLAVTFGLAVFGRDGLEESSDGGRA
jgi:ComF family protein